MHDSESQARGLRRLQPVQAEPAAQPQRRAPVRWASLFRDRRTWAFAEAKLLVDQVRRLLQSGLGMGQGQLGWIHLMPPRLRLTGGDDGAIGLPPRSV